MTRSGIFLVEMFNSPPQPYKVWHADLRTCQSCGAEVVAGYGDGPIMEHFEDGFDEWLETLKKAAGVTIIYQYEELW
ncbi:MAG: hypothetical protein GWN94_18690 [Phycisphaerae bacterium]|nr:hypothetical protein [Phycisphaerae bacterium]